MTAGLDGKLGGTINKKIDEELKVTWDKRDIKTTKTYGYIFACCREQNQSNSEVPV